MYKLSALLLISFFVSCSRKITDLPANTLSQLCNQKALVYDIKAHKGGHIIYTLLDNKKGWFFTLNKHDSVQEGKWIATTRIFPIK